MGGCLAGCGRLSSKVRNSFSFLLFGGDDGDVGGSDDERRLKPDWFKTGLRLGRREADCTCRLATASKQNTNI